MTAEGNRLLAGRSWCERWTRIYSKSRFQFDTYRYDGSTRSSRTKSKLKRWRHHHPFVVILPGTHWSSWTTGFQRRKRRSRRAWSPGNDIYFTKNTNHSCSNFLGNGRTKRRCWTSWSQGKFYPKRHLFATLISDHCRAKRVIKAKEKKEIEVRWVYQAFPW